MMSGPLDQAATLASLPPIWAEDPLPTIQHALAAPAGKVWILDDDPTGTQTIAGLPVLTHWDRAALQEEFARPEPACFVLTNSRGLTAERSRDLHAEFTDHLRAAAGDRRFSIISRGDSTLRGHYPLETDVIAQGLGGADLTLMAPYFAAGGRVTIHDTHYVTENGHLIPVGQTPFARDPVFGFRASHLPTWIEEKSAGRIAAADVVCLSLELIREQGPAAVTRVLQELPTGTVVVANATDQRDIEVIVAAVLAAESAGRRILARTAASFVCARVGQRPSPLLTGPQIRDATGTGGLIIVGSHVAQTTAQLDRLMERLDVESIELDVNDLLGSPHRDQIVAEATHAMNQALADGRHTVVHTSRDLVRLEGDDANLFISAEVSRALIELVRGIKQRPRYLIAKGGVTSSDIATAGLGVKRALVRGQLLPGVPVWSLGAETRFPGLSYVIFPGNVGDDDAVADSVQKLQASLS